MAAAVPKGDSLACTRFPPVFTAALAHRWTRCINVLHSVINEAIIENIHTHKDTRAPTQSRWEEEVFKKGKKCASHSPRNLLPIFFRFNQGTAPAFTDVTQLLSLQQRAAGLQRTSREERQRGGKR
ncbi:hypothetical protein PBY51_020067 [Eleginops maclovinus]|uniref:Uncharacterized protein n=1 Tax=Eleginops maclovinus TaxID=56733 RepID=A0AAN8ASQ1_ELEMC|nr:hypothetical protein PBY51_020067 [Eleginops maclovinus]